MHPVAVAAVAGLISYLLHVFSLVSEIALIFEDICISYVLSV